MKWIFFYVICEYSNISNSKIYKKYGTNEIGELDDYLMMRLFFFYFLNLLHLVTSKMI